MVRKSDLTLKSVAKRAESGGTYQISDFMTSEERAQVRHNNFVGKIKKKKFNDVDAFAAEVLARFGYDAYMAWRAGDISTKKIVAFVAAERAREVAAGLNMELIITNMVGACIKRQKGEKKPKGPDVARKIIKDEIKRAKGVL